MKLKFNCLFLSLLAACLFSVATSVSAAKASTSNSSSSSNAISANTTSASATTGLKNLLNPVSTLQGGFDQTVRSAGPKGSVLQRVSGKVSLKKPAQFRWEVLGKEPRLVVADGKKVWDYDKELEQVIVQNLNKGQSRAPIFFLTGDTNSLDKDFKITAVTNTGSNTCLSASDVCFELKPKKDDGSFQWIKIGFKDKTLKEMEMLDQLGQHSQFVFKDVKINQTIPATEFQFSPPKGVDVLKNNE